MTLSARRHAAGVLALAALVAVGHATTAIAQTAPASTPSPVTGRRIEVSAGVSFLAPISMGSGPVSLATANGGAFNIAQVTNRTAASVGLQAGIGFGLGSRLRVVVAGGWSHVRFQSVVTGDVEAAGTTTSTLGVSRFTAGGDIVLPVLQSGRRELFVLAGVNWLRESSNLGAGALYKDGSLIDTGLGMKLWLAERARGKIRRIGLQLEGRVGVRTGGISLDAKNTHIAPAFLASLVFGT